MIRRTSPYGGILHEVVEHNGTLYFSGLVANSLDGGIAAQSADVMRQLDTLLTAHGSSRAHVLQAVVYLTNLGDKAAFNEAWQAFFAAEHLPARAAIGIADLGPGVLLEMVVTAAKASTG